MFEEAKIQFAERKLIELERNLSHWRISDIQSRRATLDVIDSLLNQPESKEKE